MDLKGKPFYLQDEDILWVNQTLESMTLDEKIAQLFCLLSGRSKDELEKLVCSGVGGVMFHPGSANDVLKANSYLKEHSRIPFLIAADLETGGENFIEEGTAFGNQMQCAAGGGEASFRLGYAACEEAVSAGGNWTFGPVVDLDINCANPITNIRTFGNSPEKVMECGAAYLKGAQKAGCVAAAKHFPGDGVDGRDQHLHTTVNSLSSDEWHETYGKIYQRMIDEGVPSIMVSHIAQPALVKEIHPEASEMECNLPASLSFELVSGVLRKELDFQGLIVSDATPMSGFTTAMPRHEALPRAVAAGIDMLLFAINYEEDYSYLKKGIEEGILTEERVNEAVCRILALKASIGLNKRKMNMVNPDYHLHEVWAEECAERAITLVKEENGILPVVPEKYKKILLVVSGNQKILTESLEKRLCQGLTESGFQVIIQQSGTLSLDGSTRISDYKSRFDMVLYALVYV